MLTFLSSNVVLALDDVLIAFIDFLQRRTSNSLIFFHRFLSSSRRGCSSLFFRLLNKHAIRNSKFEIRIFQFRKKNLNSFKVSSKFEIQNSSNVSIDFFFPLVDKNSLTRFPSRRQELPLVSVWSMRTPHFFSRFSNSHFNRLSTSSKKRGDKNSYFNYTFV